MFKIVIQLSQATNKLYLIVRSI
uniref:Uncharacterized protein n=1 Tax=Anguilla anguilla TaxID=7936 RepID=A0A0E9PYP7_ANGAN